MTACAPVDAIWSCGSFNTQNITGHVRYPQRSGTIWIPLTQAQYGPGDTWNLLYRLLDVFRKNNLILRPIQSQVTVLYPRNRFPHNQKGVIRDKMVVNFRFG